MEATQVMEEANKIIEDFTVGQFAVYITLFLVEIGLCFWVSLNM